MLVDMQYANPHTPTARMRDGGASIQKQYIPTLWDMARKYVERTRARRRRHASWVVCIALPARARPEVNERRESQRRRPGSYLHCSRCMPASAVASAQVAGRPILHKSCSAQASVDRAAVLLPISRQRLKLLPRIPIIHQLPNAKLQQQNTKQYNQRNSRMHHHAAATNRPTSKQQ